MSEDLALNLAGACGEMRGGIVLRAMGYAVLGEDHCQSTASAHLDTPRLCFGAERPLLEDRSLLRCDCGLTINVALHREKMI